MAEEKFSIKETKEMGQFLVSAATQGDDALEDGLDFGDIRVVLDLYRKGKTAFDGAQWIDDEILDMSPAEAEELKQVFKDLDLSDDKVEDVAKAIALEAVNTYMVVKSFQDEIATIIRKVKAAIKAAKEA